MGCRKCPRLNTHCREIARVKRRAWSDWEYWGLPVPSFGPADARLLILGLAPGAHGANRTGRVFTGDSSGDFLYEVLHATGFASQPTSTSRGDGLRLIDTRISCTVHCAPPDNKPLPEEIRNCAHWLEREIELLADLRVVVTLGRVAFDAYLRTLRETGKLSRNPVGPFAHGREFRLGPELPLLIASYHPSQQNTFTGKLTRDMLCSVFLRAREVLASARRE